MSRIDSPARFLAEYPNLSRWLTICQTSRAIYSFLDRIPEAYRVDVAIEEESDKLETPRQLVVRLTARPWRPG